MPDWMMEPPTMSDAPFPVRGSRWLQLYQSVTPQPLADLRFHNDHGSHEEGSSGGSVPNSAAIGANPEYVQSFEPLEPAYHEANGDVLVDPKPRKGTRKRDRVKNWTDEETSVLVKCEALAFLDKSSPFRKQKSSATDGEAISEQLRNNPDTSASEKTGDQCRLRWYEVVNAISRKARSQKRDNPPRGVGDFTNHEGGIGNGADPVSPRIPPTYQRSPPLLLERLSSASAGISPPCSPPLHLSTGRPGPCNSSRKQIAIPGISRLPGQLRPTLLDLILGRRFLRGSWRIGDYKPCQIFADGFQSFRIEVAQTYMTT